MVYRHISVSVFLVTFFLHFLVVSTGISSVGFSEKKLPLSFYKQKRMSVLESLPQGSCALFFSSDEKNRSNDVSYVYRQDNALFYLTRLKEKEAILFITKDPLLIQGENVHEVLFIKGKDKNNEYGDGDDYYNNSEVWTGRRYGIDEAKKELGFQVIMLRKDFYKFYKKNVLQNKAQKTAFFYEPENGDMPMASRVYKNISLDNDIDVKNSYSILADLRMIKEESEIDLIQKAIDATCIAHKQLMKSTEVGMSEIMLKSIAEYVFGMNNCEYTAFPTIVASGRNSCILHHHAGDRRLEDGDLIVIDMGGEYQGYAADVTRTIPANGVFSLPQLEIYNLVLEAQKEGLKAALPGADFRYPHQVAVKIISDGLKKLGIIENKEDYRQYFMHGTSHYVGLDVHDPGSRQKLRPGEMITIEPGIYIQEGSPCDKKYWNIGIRIEDTILITSDGNRNLSGSLLKAPKAIEALMQEKGIGNISLE